MGACRIDEEGRVADLEVGWQDHARHRRFAASRSTVS
jgi:hypothetical protein